MKSVVQKEFVEKLDEKQKVRFQGLKETYYKKNLSFLIGKKIKAVAEMGIPTYAWTMAIYMEGTRLLEQIRNSHGELLDFMADFLNEYIIE